MSSPFSFDWVSLFVIGLSVSGCGPKHYAPPSDLGDCERACDVMSYFECPESKPTARGASCVQVCEANREMIRVSCVAGAGTVEELRGCAVRCRHD